MKRHSKVVAVHRWLRVSLFAALTLQHSACCVPCRRRPVMSAAKARLLTPAPFDLVKDENLPNDEQTDQNGILRNPVWGIQARSGVSSKPYAFADPYEPQFKCFDRRGAFNRPECTTQVAYCDLPSGVFHPALCALVGECTISGHMNWTAATYDGALVWDSLAEDWDYNFLLYSPRQAGLTVASCTERKKAIGIEFDSREVIDPLGGEDPQFWWNRLRDAVNNPESPGSMAFLNEIKGKRAILTGLMNLDCEHGSTTELHPLWTMAIHLRDTSADDVWIFLVRNWGNEGFCSSEQHYLERLPSDQFTFRLPWRNKATSVSVDTQSSEFYGDQVSSPEVTYRTKDAAFVSFKLPAVEKRALSLGELHLKWDNGQTEPVDPVGPIDSDCPLAAAATQAPPSSAEDRLGEARRILIKDKSKLQLYNRALPTPATKARMIRQQVGAAKAEPAPPARPKTPPRVRSARDDGKIRRDDAELSALCTAFNNNIPNLPGACKKNKK